MISLFQNGSPQVTPTKYRPDGGDRYIPLREDEKEWTKKYSKIDLEIFNIPRGRPSAKRNLTASMGGSTTGRESSSSNHPTYSHTSNNNNSGSSPSMTNMGVVHPPAHNQGATYPPDDSYHDFATHRALLSNELLNESIVDIRVSSSREYASLYRSFQSEYAAQDGPRVLFRQPPDPLFRFSNKTPVKHGVPSSSVQSPLFSSSPLSADSQRLLKSPRKPQRKVPKNPYKVLDAPELQDDFYLNLVDWSSQNILSVGLSACVYLWNAANSQVVKLCDLAPEADTVTSVQWTERGDYLAVGTNKGKLQIWDAHAQKAVHTFESHSGRIGCLAWNADTICSGSRDRTISVRDIREGNSDKKLSHHRQEVSCIHISKLIEISLFRSVG